MTCPASSLMITMMQIMESLTPLNRAVCSQGYDRAVACLCDLLPFRVITTSSSCEHNGWVIPPSWDVEEAKIVKDGRIVYDGAAHPLGVIGLSKSFCGTVALEELRSHLHYDHRYDDSIPYHYRQFFRSWSRDWGFCMPKQIYDTLEPGDYEVLIRTKETPGEMKILEYRHAGSSDFTIVLGGNLDHAGVANDGLAGCVAGMEVMRRLRGQKTKLSYALVLSPGIIGSEFYLALLSKSERSRILEGVFLEMLGANAQLAVQDSRREMISIGYALRTSLDHLGLCYRTGGFESIIVNDEYLWENYGIPMLSFSRFPYPEYHSSKDSMAAVSERALNEAVEALLGAIRILEDSPMIVKKFEGNICLSNPRFDLYADCGQIALGDVSTDDRRKKRFLMDLLPALDRPVSVRTVAAKVSLSEQETLEYLKRWEAKKLIELL
jgi:aminopeptidase-like protein